MTVRVGLATIDRVPIPSRREALAVLVGLRPAARLVRHSAAVAEIATYLAACIAERGIKIDRRLTESAALLHDMDKALPKSDPLLALGHGHAGAQWLRGHGFAELAPAVDGHPVSRLADDDHWRVWSRAASLEERVVAYADKRAAQRLGSMDKRFARWERRHPEYHERLSKARARASILERDVCAAAGIAPADVRRRRWVATIQQRSGEPRAETEADEPMAP